MMIKTLENIEEGIFVEEQVAGDVKFADDQGMVSVTKSPLQSKRAS